MNKFLPGYRAAALVLVALDLLWLVFAIAPRADDPACSRTVDKVLGTAGTKLLDLPGGPINQHWTQGLLANAVVPDHAFGPHTASLGPAASSGSRRSAW
jgi:glucose/arabinose dehydrogenase